MKVFYKSAEDSFLALHSKITNLPDMSGVYHMGIDGSTTSFGLSLIHEQDSSKHLWQFMRDNQEDRDSFMSNLFPFLNDLLAPIDLRIVTYERTPDDFDDNSRMVRIMKQTEKAIANFLQSSHRLNIIDKDYIFPIFPNSWKSFLVAKDVENNYNKTNKRLNAIDILDHTGLDPDLWLHELDSFSGHMYDCVEALGICRYGCDFLYKNPLVRTYRNFSRRRPLHMVAKFVATGSELELIKEVLSLVRTPHFMLYAPNEYHTVFENLYALDDDARLGILLTDRNDSIRPYLEHLFGVHSGESKTSMISFVLRQNAVSDMLLPRLSAKDFSHILV